jgi:hypothetical protein
MFQEMIPFGAKGSILVQAFCYKPEGRRVQTRRNNLMLSLCLILPVALGLLFY